MENSKTGTGIVATLSIWFLCGSCVVNDPVSPGPAPDALPPTDASPAPDLVKYAPCPAATLLTTQAGLVAAVKALPWEDLHQLVSKTLAVSDDYQVAGTLVLDAGSFSSPPTCPAVMGCPSHPTIWTHRDGWPGVTCKQKSTIKYGGCHRLELKDTTVRFRALVWDFHPSERIAVMAAVWARTGDASKRRWINEVLR